MKNLRNCYAAFLLFALLFVSAAAPAQTDLQQKLGRISAITETRPLESTRFSEKYVTYFTQPLDHRRPEKGSFRQRVIVSHVGFDRPTVIVTEGYGAAYALNPKYREELSELLDANTVSYTHLIYPVYIDSNVMCGRAGVLEGNGQWSNVTYMPCTAENDFIPEIPDKRIDIVYLCYPNNPTGTTLTKPELKKWVDYALANDTLILFDAAYEAFIREDDVPHSIYEIKGAKKCAIEFRSFSKTAGFTGVRCGYTVVPKELTAATLEGERIPLNKLWNRRQSTKFNGTSYITQRAAEAIYTPEGQRQIKETIDYYMDNARTMKQGLEAAGLKVYGGVNAPYIWLKTPDGTGSWRFFEQMLYEANVVGTPGVGFGPSGEGYIRLTAFGKHEDCVEAMKRIRKWLK